MKKVFLDVGGHLGQTLEEVLKPLYRFDEIWCFEPFAPCADILEEKFKDPRLRIARYGLSNVTGPLRFYSHGHGHMGSTTKADENSEMAIVTECDFVRASEFFAEHIGPDDLVVMKLNCEGSECDIMNDLIDGDQIGKLDNVMIDFDVRKFPAHAHEEPALKARMAEIDFERFSLCDRVMKGRSHQKRIANWLRSLPFHDQFRPQADWREHLRGALRL
ncbi:MAG: FkbM family methyltransferase [Pseudomonadota bacterium]